MRFTRPIILDGSSAIPYQLDSVARKCLDKMIFLFIPSRKRMSCRQNKSN